MELEIIECGYAKNGSGEEYFREKIKRMYKLEEECGNKCSAILYVQPKIKSKYPDFILIDKYRGIAILEIKDWSYDFISSVNVLEITTKDNRKMTNPAHQCRTYFNFLNSLFEHHYRLLCNEIGNFKYNLISKAVMINLSYNEIANLDYFMKSEIVDFISKDSLRNLTLDEIFNNRRIEIPDNHINLIRCLINPEIKIAESVDEKIELDNRLQKLIKVLDYEQEKFAKRIIDGHYIISGVPGSGKTIILLTRALYIVKTNPEWKVKIVCYNNSLANKLQNRIVTIDKELGLDYYNINKNNISISTFHRLCGEFYKYSKEEQYKNGGSYFNEFWPRMALKNSYEKYDAILVDEYQDFYEDWLKLCLSCCKKHNGKENLFLAGDRLQSIYNPKETSWKSLGINIQGRSKLLKLSYRTGKNYIQTALTFLQNDSKLKEEVNNFYEGSNDIKSNDFGKEIKFLSGDYSKIGREIETLLKNGYKAGDILILVDKTSKYSIILKALSNNIQDNAVIGKDIEEGKLCITTYHSSKGLENKICFLLDLDMLVDKKLAYVGMTRASELLYIHANDYVSDNFASEIREIAEK